MTKAELRKLQLMEDISGNNNIKIEPSGDEDEANLCSNLLKIPTEHRLDELEYAIEKKDPELFDPNEFISTQNFIPINTIGGSIHSLNKESYDEVKSVLNYDATKICDLYKQKFNDNAQLNHHHIKSEDSVSEDAKDTKLGIVKVMDNAPKSNARLNDDSFKNYIIQLCPVCGKEFQNLKNWRLHLRCDHDFYNMFKKGYTHIKNVGYQCNECKVMIKSGKGLRGHAISHLPYKGTFTCRICGESRGWIENLRAHIKKCHLDVVGRPIKDKYCQYCEKTISYKGSLLEHIRKAHGEFCNKKILFVCPVCGMNFRNNKSYWMHTNSTHEFNTLQGLSFEEISYGLDDDSNIALERRMKYWCIKCDLVFPNCKITLLRQHAVTHLPHKKYKCRYCDYANSSKNKLSLHTCQGCLDAFKYVPKMVRKKNDIKRLLNRNIRNKADRIYVCPSCGEEFDTLILHASHLKAAHGLENINSLNINITKGDVSSDGSSELKHNCNVCNKVFKRPILINLKTHAFSHMAFKMYKCTLCNSSSNRPVACLCKHSAVLKGISFVCPQCKVRQQFKTEEDWTAHIEQYHPDLLTPNGLNFTQINSMNAEQTIYKCNNCGKTEKNLNSKIMLLHAIKHMSKKCFKCEKCGNSYECKGDASKHVYNCVSKKELRSDDEKIFIENWRTCYKFAKCQCPICGFIEEENVDSELVGHLDQVHDTNFQSIDDLNFAKCTQEASKAENSYTCLECNQSLVGCSINKLQEHKLTHLPYRMWHCSFCEEKFYTKAKILDHVIELHLKKKHTKKIDILSLLSFACPVCNEKSNLFSDWRAHLNTKHGFNTLAGLRLSQEKNLLKCMDCYADVGEERKFAHRLIHLPYSSYKCRFCNTLYKTFKVARAHTGSCRRKHVVLKKLENIKNKTKASCSISKVNNPFEKGTLKALHSIGAYVDYACTECIIKFSSEKLLKIHINKQHLILNRNEQQSYYKIICKICLHYVKNRNSMIMHMKRRHLAAVDLKCDICHEHFKTHCEFYTHMKTQHTDIASWPKNVCPICVEILPVGTNIEFHTKIIHLMEGMNEEEKKSDSQLPGITGLVIKTAEVASSVSNPPAEVILPDTISSENNETAAQSVTTMATCSKKSSALNKYILYFTYACPECNLPLSTQKEWHAHITTEHDFFAENSLNIKDTPGVGRKSICMDCGITVTRSALHKQRHKLTHMPHRAFICKICFHRSKTQNLLCDHMKRKHFMPGKYQCEMCSLVFQTACERYTHANEDHKDIKWPKKVCRICVTTLSKGTAMDEHMKTHSSDREQFPCSYCQRFYLTNSELNRHLKEKHDAEIGKKPETRRNLKERKRSEISCINNVEETFVKENSDQKIKDVEQIKVETLAENEAADSSRGRPIKAIASGCIQDANCTLDFNESIANVKTESILPKTPESEEMVDEYSNLGSELITEKEAPEHSRRKRGRPRKTINLDKKATAMSADFGAPVSSKRKRGMCITDRNCTLDFNNGIADAKSKILSKTLESVENVDEYSNLGSYLNDFVTSLEVKEPQDKT